MFQLGLQEVASRYLSIQFFCKSDLYTVHLFFNVNTVLWGVVFWQPDLFCSHGARQIFSDCKMQWKLTIFVVFVCMLNENSDQNQG